MATVNPDVQDRMYSDRMYDILMGFLDYTNLKFKKEFDKAYNRFLSNPNEDTLNNAITSISYADQLRICKAFLKREELPKIREFLNTMSYYETKMYGGF